MADAIQGRTPSGGRRLPACNICRTRDHGIDSVRDELAAVTEHWEEAAELN